MSYPLRSRNRLRQHVPSTLPHQTIGLAGLCLFLFLIGFSGCEFHTGGVTVADRNESPHTDSRSTSTIADSANGEALSGINDVLVLFWNVENLFDDNDDPGAYDDEWADWWDSAHYHRKLDHLARVILAALKNDSGSSPVTKHDAVILAFAELENERVLVDLAERLRELQPGMPLLKPAVGRRDTRIRVGALAFPAPGRTTAHLFRSDAREILELEFTYRSSRTASDTALHVLINHWKSRRGGRMETEPQRVADARGLRERVNSILQENPAAEIVLLGDFNDEPTNRSIRDELRAIDDRRAVRNAVALNHIDVLPLYNCLAATEPGRGTYRYQNQWQLLDQIILAPGVLDERGLSLRDCAIYTYDGRLIRYGEPWNYGSRDRLEKNRGYSDHLPIRLRLRMIQ